MTAAQYDECIALLKKAGAHHPPGRLYHVSFGNADKIQVFDVWTSQEQFDRFGQVLMPILQKMGVDPGQPMIAQVHNVVVPPAKAAAPKKRPKAAARKRPARSARRTRGRKK